MQLTKSFLPILIIFTGVTAFAQTTMLDVLKTRALIMYDDLEKVRALGATSCNAKTCVCDPFRYARVGLAPLCPSGTLDSRLRTEKLREKENEIRWQDEQSVADAYLPALTDVSNKTLADQLFLILADETYRRVSGRNALAALKCNAITCECDLLKLMRVDKDLGEFCKKGAYDSNLRTNQLAEDNRLLLYEYADKLTLAARIATGSK